MHLLACVLICAQTLVIGLWVSVIGELVLTRFRLAHLQKDLGANYREEEGTTPKNSDEPLTHAKQAQAVLVAFLSSVVATSWHSTAEDCKPDNCIQGSELVTLVIWAYATICGTVTDSKIQKGAARSFSLV